MTTIYVVTAEKEYSSPKVLAAFDTEEGASGLKKTIEEAEPRWVIEVHPVELTNAPAKGKPGGVIPGPRNYIVGERSDGEPGDVYRMPVGEKAYVE